MENAIKPVSLLAPTPLGAESKLIWSHVHLSNHPAQEAQVWTSRVPERTPVLPSNWRSAERRAVFFSGRKSDLSASETKTWKGISSLSRSHSILGGHVLEKSLSLGTLKSMVERKPLPNGQHLTEGPLVHFPIYQGLTSTELSSWVCHLNLMPCPSNRNPPRFCPCPISCDMTQIPTTALNRYREPSLYNPKRPLGCAKRKLSGGSPTSACKACSKELTCSKFTPSSRRLCFCFLNFFLSVPVFPEMHPVQGLR